MSSVHPDDHLALKKNFEDKKILDSVNDIFMHKRGYTFQMPKSGSKVFLMLSGGMDSICLWYLLMQKYKLQVYPVNFYDPEARKPGQDEALAYFSSLFQTQFPNEFITVKQMATSFMFSFRTLFGEGMISKLDLRLLVPNIYFDKTDDRYHAGIISNPIRLSSYLYKTYEYAMKLRYLQDIDITTIFCGVVKEDAAICRESTLTGLRTTNLSLCLALGDYRYQLSSPLEKQNRFYYTKKDLVRYAIKHRLPIEKTWSCDESGKVQCGVCLSCITRKRLFKQMNIFDKTNYIPTLFQTKKHMKKLRSMVKVGKTKILRILSKESKNQTVTDTSQISIPNDVMWETIGNTLYRFQTTTGCLDSVNDSGSQIWRLIQSKKQISLFDLIKELAKIYPSVNKNKLIYDVKAFIQSSYNDQYLTIQNE